VKDSKRYENKEFRNEFKDYILNCNEDTSKRIEEVNKVIILEEQRDQLQLEHPSRYISNPFLKNKELKKADGNLLDK